MGAEGTPVVLATVDCFQEPRTANMPSPAPVQHNSGTQAGAGLGADLLHCCVRGDEPWLMDLLAQGASPNALGCHGELPLHMATQHGHATMCRLLVAHGADVHAVDGDGYTVLRHCLTRTFEHPHLAAAMVLLEAGAPMDVAGEEAACLMHAACRQGNGPACVALLDRGVSPLIEDPRGRMAYHRALLEKHFELVECMLVRGVDVNVVDRNGTSAMHLAAALGHVDLLKWLVLRGGDPNHYGGHRFTPLHSATVNGKEESILCLLNLGADFMRRDGAGRSAASYMHEAHRSRSAMACLALAENFGRLQRSMSQCNRYVNVMMTLPRTRIEAALRSGDVGIVLKSLDIGIGEASVVTQQQLETAMVRARADHRLSEWLDAAQLEKLFGTARSALAHRAARAAIDSLGAARDKGMEP